MPFTHVKTGYEPLDMKVMETSFGRFYESPTKKGKWYPSVTTVTGHAKQEFFAKWRQKEGNEKVLKYCQDRGNLLHETIEHYLNNNNEYVDALSGQSIPKSKQEHHKVSNALKYQQAMTQVSNVLLGLDLVFPGLC